jgi:CoA-disulfide reductase
MSKKVIIVGGVAGGAAAAARLRRMDEHIQIIMFERGEFISFANCGLPYYIGGIIEERESLIVQTVEDMIKKFDIDIRNLTEVIKIDSEKKTVTVKNLKTDEIYEESYDSLLLSPGAKPIKPPIPGIEEADNVFTLRTIPDTDVIKSFIETTKPKNAVVIGGGFIGIEMAENLKHSGLDITLIEMADQIIAPMDFEMASILHGHVQDKGVHLILKDGVKAFENKGRKILLQSGKEIHTDLIILAIGVIPENHLAKELGLKLGQKGGILVNNHLQTSDPSIFAVGDAVEVVDYINENPVMIPLAGPAAKQGRIAANNIYGLNEVYKGTMGTAVVKVFDMTAASTGNSEKILKKLGEKYTAIHISPNSWAGYYPGATPLYMKLVFNPDTGKIYGAQAIGIDGVEKRIDVIATAIKGNLNVMDLEELELSYAPPYSSAKDPVNMLGYVASNIMEGLVDIIQWHEVGAIDRDKSIIIDVREKEERELGFIPDSIHIPLGDIRSRISEIPKDKDIYIYCQVGLRAYMVSRILMQHGYKVKNIDGGFRLYSTVYPESQFPGCEVAVNDLGDSEVHCDPKDLKVKIKVDARGLQCPGPIRQVYNTVESMNEGEILEVKASDPGFQKDIQVWCRKMGNKLLSVEANKKEITAYIQKGNILEKCSDTEYLENNEKATLVVFSQDLDKALASFIIATGAAAMGKKVTLFFTFWGLNILRKEQNISVKKDFLEKMFGWMMPKGTKKLPISNMNMGGMGAKMIQYVMKKKNVDSLETLIQNAMESGVKIVACTMSMDIMGIKEEELIDGIEMGGVATYLGETDDSGLNLFI